MPQNRSTRSGAPSPSSRRSAASVHMSSLNLRTPEVVLPIIHVPKLRRPPSPNVRLTPLSQPRASANHDPPLPVTFHWSCCRSDCRHRNTFFTGTHFTRIRHVRGLEDSWSWAPSYRVAKCQACSHAVCEQCALLQVTGQSEWKGAEIEEDFVETGDVGVWRRIGIWGEGKRFGISEWQGRGEYEDIVRELETSDRIGRDWVGEWLRDRQWQQKVSAR
jgi:hypothetical protein